MKMSLAISICSSLLALLLPIITGGTLILPVKNILDMTHQFRENETVYWPGAEKFTIDLNTSVYNQEENYKMEMNSFSAAEHGGTHIDAPIHFAEGKWTVDKIPSEKLIGPGVVIDISERAGSDPVALVEAEDIKKWERQSGEIPDNAIVLFNTGWDRHWPIDTKFMGIQAGGELHFPGLGPDAAEWLVKNRNIVGVGIDTASIDHGVSTNFRTHVILSTANKYILENVANMDKLPGPKGFTIVALPMKIFDGTGAPTRVLALYDDQASGGCRASTGPSIVFIVLLLVLGIFLKEVS